MSSASAFIPLISDFNTNSLSSKVNTLSVNANTATPRDILISSSGLTITYIQETKIEKRLRILM